MTVVAEEKPTITKEAEILLKSIAEGIDTSRKLSNHLNLNYGATYAAVRRLVNIGLVKSKSVREPGAYTTYLVYTVTGMEYELCQRKKRGTYTKEEPKYAENTYSNLDFFIYPQHEKNNNV